MRPSVARATEQSEVVTLEGCYILELANSPDDAAVSIARARVPTGVTTANHRLRDVDERYVILEGSGRVTVGDQLPTPVTVGDVVSIPRNTAQAITNTGDSDLVFLCICTPRFTQKCYEEIADD